MNLPELKSWAQERYQEETRRAAQSVSVPEWRAHAERARVFLEVIEKIEEEEREQ